MPYPLPRKHTNFRTGKPGVCLFPFLLPLQQPYKVSFKPSTAALLRLPLRNAGEAGSLPPGVVRSSAGPVSAAPGSQPRLAVRSPRPPGRRRGSRGQPQRPRSPGGHRGVPFGDCPHRGSYSWGSGDPGRGYGQYCREHGRGA